MDFKTITFELRDNGIGIVTLNRPDKLNAITFQMVEELHKLCDHLMVNLDCRVLIIKGAGKAFCAGSDLNEAVNILLAKRKLEEYKRFFFLDVPEEVKGKLYYQSYISALIVKMRKISQPIITMIHGACSGGGFAFAMAADIRIACEDAKFNNAPINIGLTGTDVGTSYFLPRLIGASRATEILYTGRIFDSQEAERIGFILKAVEREELFDSTLELAHALLKKSPLGLRMTKEALNITLSTPSLETILNLENSAQVICMSTKDIWEGAKTFFEKKEANYPLR